jgi:transcriptional regulator with XRE-family HTH domain
MGDKYLALNLKQVRERNGYTRAELAKVSGVDRVTIYRAENALTDLKVSTVRALSDALDVRPGELLN